MTKRVELTEDLLNKMKVKFGEDVDANKFYIFKCRAFSTEPVHQGTIYDGATADSGILVSMVNKVNNTDENIGVHIMHEDHDLNIGRVFDAELSYEQDGVTAIMCTCALLENEENKGIIEKIENSILDEVSVQFLPEHAYCSVCHWDYMGEDADFTNWWDKTCPEGHVIGFDGCHLELEGLKAFSEVSIVNRGAAKNPKILSQSKRSLFSEGELMSLAASGKNPDFLVATFNSKMEKIMEDKTLSAEEKVAGLEAELAEMKRKLDLEEKVKSLEIELSESKENLESKEKEMADVVESHKAETEAQKAEVESLKEELAAANENFDKAMAFLKEEVAKVNVAAGKKDVEVPCDLDGISAMLKDSQSILVSLIPAGGVSKQVTYSEEKAQDIKLKSFQVKR